MSELYWKRIIVSRDSLEPCLWYVYRLGNKTNSNATVEPMRWWRVSPSFTLHLRCFSYNIFNTYLTTILRFIVGEWNQWFTVFYSIDKSSEIVLLSIIVRSFVKVAFFFIEQYIPVSRFLRRMRIPSNGHWLAAKKGNKIGFLLTIFRLTTLLPFSSFNVSDI